MEEELNENDLEERLYALIHHVDETLVDENTPPHQDVIPRVEDAPRSTVRRYWRTSYNSSYQKTNTPKDAAPTTKTTTNVNKTTPAPKTTKANRKEECNTFESAPSEALLILQNSAPQNFEKTVEILDIDEPVVELESSDEDEVIEVALPPKPTITIESSDEDEVIVAPSKKSKTKQNGNAVKENKSANNNNRDISTSPVPSVVSSMSDDFIRGDCLALNISAAQPDNQSFDFSLHGSDLLGDGTPSKKKKKKKSKDRLTSTPIAPEPPLEAKKQDNIFATPKSKAKNKKQKTKSYAVSEIIIPNADIYDSDSNQSLIEINKHHDAYIVAEKSFPNENVYESVSSAIESIGNPPKASAQQTKRIVFADSSDSNTSEDVSSISKPEQQLKSKNQAEKTRVDLTGDNSTLEHTAINENIVIGNISGFTESVDYGDDSLLNSSSIAPKELGRFCSTKVPSILFENLDFDNLKGTSTVCRRRRYSLTTLRAEMEKFYNESWGGENFNHHEILKNMPRDKSLWVIDPKDRMPNTPKRKVICNLCNRPGHRDDTCRLKMPVCHMCGHTGHYEPRCPRKICINCGSPNFVYSTMCRNCASWNRLSCPECSQPGHPATHCPDLWRRYHNTIDENMPMESSLEKAHNQQHCSGCARRGHLVHACRSYVPFCTLPVPSPRVARYWRLYPPSQHNSQDDTVSSVSTPRTDRNKRPSKSPTAHETHVNKKRITEEDVGKPRKLLQTKEPEVAKTPAREPPKNAVEETIQLPKEADKAPDYIPLTSNNHDKKGHVIQDNEVSDTSEVVTSARIYLTKDAVERLMTPKGQSWLKECTEKIKVDVQKSDATSFILVKGTVGDQEAFQSELREWTKSVNDQEAAAGDGNISKKQIQNDKVCPLPKKKNDMLRTLGNAFESLKRDIGDPKKLYKELMYLQNHHESLVHQKEVSHTKLKNNSSSMKTMMKKLNMVLLGQAGLAEGSKHLSNLYSLQERVINLRQQNIPLQMRQEINQNYENIFTGVPRHDYMELVEKFYVGKEPAVFKKKKNNTVKLNKKQKKNFKNGVLQQKRPLRNDNKKPANVENAENLVNGNKCMPSKPKIFVNKLIFCHRRLLKTRENDRARERYRLDLVKKLQKHISSLRDPNSEIKATKSMRKVRSQALKFLNDV